MYSFENERIRLTSGFYADISKEVSDSHFNDFTELQFFSFNHAISAGIYFPQIVQFINVFVGILQGYTDWKVIILGSILSGGFYTLLWFLFHFYKIPGLSALSCLLGGSIFRFNLHIVAIAAVAFFVVKDWKVLVYCIIAGIIATLIRVILFSVLSNVKYNDGVVKYISAFKYKL